MELITKEKENIHKEAHSKLIDNQDAVIDITIKNLYKS